MRTLRMPRTVAPLVVVTLAAFAQTIAIPNQLWRDTVNAVQRGDQAQANAKFEAFNTAVRTYVTANGKDWQIEYLVGSLDCLFPDKKAVGAEFLRDILQNNRTLNDQGTEELQKLLTACEAKAKPVATAVQMTVPQDITEASTHYQLPSVHGDMKSGARVTAPRETSAPVDPVASADLLARRVSLMDRDQALRNAIARLPAGAVGAVVGEFAVASTTGTEANAAGIRQCLHSFANPLHAEFQIDSPAYVITAYAVPSNYQVYDYAIRLHGLHLPMGVLAYSVPEDMSIVSPATPTNCGSMAHELVHLLIKRRFPGAPAWLEEGLASAVAVAAPSPTALRLEWSWRDQTLLQDWAARPTVDQLLNDSWSDFSSSSYTTAHKVEAIQAMAPVFIRYLDSKGKLTSIYFSVRDQHVSSDLSGFKSYQATLEDALNMPIAAIDADFQQWFMAEAKRNHAVVPPTSPATSPAKPCVMMKSAPMAQQAPVCAPNANAPADMPAYPAANPPPKKP